MELELIYGDCLEIMPSIDDKSIDMILCDLPYGTSACKWDSIIDLDSLWKEYKRIVKPESAIVLTASQPFTTKLISSNMEMFKYCWVWEKTKATGYFDVKYRPMKIHEDICIFGFGGVSNCSNPAMKYNPQGLTLLDKPKKYSMKNTNATCRSVVNGIGEQTITNYPKSIIKEPSASKTVHPTQKPVALLEYLIKTYTDEQDTVLDNCMGSGSTGIACKNLNRNFIGIELGKEYFEIAKKRIEES